MTAAMIPSLITHPISATLFMTIGCLLASLFVVYEATSTRLTRSIVQELLYALSASIVLGFGIVLLFVATGVTV